MCCRKIQEELANTYSRRDKIIWVEKSPKYSESLFNHRKARFLDEVEAMDVRAQVQNDISYMTYPEFIDFVLHYLRGNQLLARVLVHSFCEAIRHSFAGPKLKCVL